MPPAGLEPATLWLEATRAVRLRHEGRENYCELIIFSVKLGPLRESNSRPLAPKASIIPLDQAAFIGYLLVSF